MTFTFLGSKISLILFTWFPNVNVLFAIPCSEDTGHRWTPINSETFGLKIQAPCLKCKKTL